MVCRHSVRIVALVCIALANIAIARGDFVSNGSFESPAVGDGVVGGLTGWTAQLLYAPSGGAWNTYNPMDGYFPGSTYASPEQPGYLPNPAEGLQSGYGYLKSGDWMYMYQDVGDPAINTKYTLTFAVGAGPNASPDWNVNLIDTATQAQLYAKMSSGDAGVNLPTAGTFVENTISWTNTTVTAGGLQVFIAATGKTGVEGWQELFIDNIRLTAETVPEPCAISMVGTALVCLLAYAWRRRK